MYYQMLVTYFFIITVIMLLFQAFLCFLSWVSGNVLRHQANNFPKFSDMSGYLPGFIVEEQSRQRKRYSDLESPKINVIICSNYLRVVRMLATLHLLWNPEFQSIAFSLTSLLFCELQCLATHQVEYNNSGFTTRQHQLFSLTTHQCYYTCSALLPPIAFPSSLCVNTCEKSIIIIIVRCTYYNFW